MRFKKVRSKAAAFCLIMILAVVSKPALSADDLQQAGMEQGPKRERFNMTYIYFGNTAAYTGYVNDTKGSLDDISPSYFDLNKDGTLKLTGAIDRGFIDAMHKRGIKVTPFLSNHWDAESGKNALDKPEILAGQIADAIAKYDLDGVNVDIENMSEKERDKYTQFVSILRMKLPSSKSVSVAVAANPYRLTKGWHASYDFAALQLYCDYLMLMAYDEHYQGNVNYTGGAGPVAGHRFVEEAIKAALKEVPADKLVLGVPFYGRLWKRGASYGGYGISNNTVEALIEEFNGRVEFDNIEKSPKAVIAIGAADRKPVIFGEVLEQGTYDIWYENEASIKRKLELVEKYDLKGTGSWSLGQETKETWEYYSLWLNGRYFIDIQGHWAIASIIAAMDNGWMEGVSSTQFMPDSAMTRAQAAALLVRVLDIGMTSPASGKPVFADVISHWAREEIEAAAKAGILQGVGAGMFEPDKELTREQMAVILDRLLDGGMEDADSAGDTGSKAGSVIFRDVDPSISTWSYEAIGRMTAKGFLEGFPDGTFRPRDTIRRGQMAVLIERTAPKLIGS